MRKFNFYIIIFVLYLLFSSPFNVYADATFDWVSHVGGSSSDSVTATGVAVDSSGNVYTTGSFSGTADFDPGPGTYNLTSGGGADIFVTKFDTDGKFIWAKSFVEDGGFSIGYAIAVDASGNVYTTGNFAGTTDFDPGGGTYNLTSGGGRDIFVSKLDTDGNFLWAKSFVGDGGFGAGYAITVDGSGNVYTAGALTDNGTADFDPGAGTYDLTGIGSSNTFVSKLDSNGEFVWASLVGSGSDTIAQGIALDSGRNVYIDGDFNGTADFDPGAGTADLTSAGDNDAFIFKLDTSGAYVWAQNIGGTGFDAHQAIAIDGDNNIYTAGSFQGTVDFDFGAGVHNLSSLGTADIFVRKIDADGNFIWAKNMGGGISTNSARGITIAANGNVYTTGTFGGTVDFDPGAGIYNLTGSGGADTFISALNKGGGFIGATSIQINTSVNLSYAIGADSGSNVYISGYFVGTLRTPLGDITSGAQDAYISKLSFEPDITPPSVISFSPADDNTSVSTTSNLVIVFDEAVNVATGNIVIKKSSDDSIFETINVTSGNVTGGNTDTITINPSANLLDGVSYYVQIDSAAFTDPSNNSYAGIADSTTWNFSTPSPPSVFTPPASLAEVDVDLSDLSGSNSFSSDTGNYSRSISADNRYVAFFSEASNLVLQTTNGSGDIFLRDTQTNITTLISIATDGTEGGDNFGSFSPSISADGRYVAFVSSASNLVSGHANDHRNNVYVRDTQMNITTLVSVNTGGTQGGNSGSVAPSISSDGRYISFTSFASNLVASDLNGRADIFLRDTQTNTTTLISVATNGTDGGDGNSDTPSISADGRYVAFKSGSSNLVPETTGGDGDVFLRDTQTNTTTLISVATNGTDGGDGNSDTPSISADGRYVAFVSSASNLVPETTISSGDIFLRDTQTGATTLISVIPDGTEGGNNSSYYASISGDGRYVAFSSDASDLLEGDANGNQDIFLRDTQTNITTIISVATDGLQGNSTSKNPSISSDGLFVAFTSDATNLLPPDVGVGQGNYFLAGVPPSIVAPTVSTSPASSITQTGATLNGETTATGGADATARGFNWGLDTSYGTNVTQNTGPYGIGTFSATLAGLTCNTTYNFRAFATNTAGTTNGTNDSFTTSACSSPGGRGGGGSSGGHVGPILSPLVPPSVPSSSLCKLGDKFSTATGLPCSSSPKIPPQTCIITITLRQGAKGEQVKCLQTILKLTSDGIFGPKTKTAVIIFQKLHKLVPDGIVGPKTRALLL